MSSWTQRRTARFQRDLTPVSRDPPRVHGPLRSASAPRKGTDRSNGDSQKVRLDCLLLGADAGGVTSVRVPQEERTRAMRARLMEATVDCLVEYGWSGT